MKKIGFVGLGNMGTGMALNLQKAGAQVLAFDLDKDKLRELEAHGIIGCDSIKEIVEQVDDAIITMVRNREQTESVLFGENGVTSSSIKGKTVIVMSTLNPSIMTELEKDVLEAGFNIIDAPVSGSLSGASQGSLAIFVAGKRDLTETMQAYFEAMGSNVFNLGEEIGAGQAAKLANNLILGVNMTALSEAINFGSDYGLKESDILDIVKVSTGDSWVANNWDEIKEYKTNGTVDAIYKDLTSVMTEATKHQRFVPVSGLVLNLLHNTMEKHD